MTATRVFTHENYELQCGAKPLSNGQFQATLVVCKQVWPTRAREIAMPRTDHPTAEAAIEAAHQQALVWIKDYG